PNTISSDYIFPAQQPGGSLFVGANTITLAPVPLGVNGSDVNHYVYISGGTGTAEACKIIGGTGTSAASSGQIAIMCANSHSGAWTVQTATAGIQEALNAFSFQHEVKIPPGFLTLNGPIFLEQGFNLIGSGTIATTLVIPNTFPLSVPGIIDYDSSVGNFSGIVAFYAAGPQVRDFAIMFIQPDSGVLANMI